jgi:hypothetical protein
MDITDLLKKAKMQIPERIDDPEFMSVINSIIDDHKSAIGCNPEEYRLKCELKSASETSKDRLNIILDLRTQLTVAREEIERLRIELDFYRAEEKRFREEAAEKYMQLKAAREEIDKLKAENKKAWNHYHTLCLSAHPTCETCGKGDIEGHKIECMLEYPYRWKEKTDYCSAHTELNNKGELNE